MFAGYLYALTALAATTPNPGDLQPGQVVQWKTENGGSGHYYQAVYSPGGADWPTANSYALSVGGYLATIRSSAENLFIYSLIDDPKFWGVPVGGDRNVGPWLGGQRLPGGTKPEDNWVWIHDGSPITYTNWAPTEPDSGGLGGEDYLHYMSYDQNDRQPTWNDVGPEYMLHGLVVEYDSNPGASAGGSGARGASPAPAQDSATPAPDPSTASSNPVQRNPDAILPEGVMLVTTPPTSNVHIPTTPPVIPKAQAPLPPGAVRNPFDPSEPYYPTTATTHSSASSSAAVPNLQEGSTLEWPVAKGGNGHYYQAVYAPGGINWADAQQSAHTHGGYLATIISKEENDFVFKLIDDPKFWHSDGHYSDGPWLGGVKTPGFARPNQGWHWINDDSTFTFTNWAPPNPDNSGGIEDRLNFWCLSASGRQGTWNDKAGRDLTLGFVIEYDAGAAPGAFQYVALFAFGLMMLLVLATLVITYFRHAK